MSKNLTRKGLAFGAAVSLGTTLFAGAPAFAVEAVTLEAAEGSSYNVPLGTSFNLAAYFTDAAQQGAEAVKFRVVDAAGNLDVTDDSTSANDASGYGGTSYSADTNVSDDDEVLLTDSNADGVWFVAGSTSVAPTKSYLALLNKSTVTTTFSVTVQAFMDLDDDNVIDTGEAASEIRTVQFVATDDIKATSVVESYGLGDTAIKASVKTTPELNGAVLADASNVSSAILGKVTNAVSTDVFDSTQTKWDETNKEWDVTTTLPSIVPTGAAATSNVVTLTKATHGLLAGETIRVSGLTVDADANITAVIATVPTTGTLTYAAANVATVGDLGVLGSPLAQVVVGANTYSFKPYRSTTALGDAVASTVGTASAATATSTAVENADQYKSTGTNTLTVTVRKGKTATATYSVVDSKGASVGAGKSVRLTVSGVNGTLKVNGASTASANGDVINAVTDASGNVAISVATTSASASDAITLTAVTESVAGTSEAITFNWDAAVYEIVDLNDSAAFATPGAVRSAAKGASYAFNLAVVDKWGAAADAATYRILATVSGRTVWAKPATLSNGRASVSVEDGGLTTGDTTVKFNIQKLVSGTWTTNAVDADVVDWDGEADEQSSVAIKYYNQTDAINLNADGVSSADLSVTRSATTTKAVDRRVSTNEAFDTTGLDAVTVTGNVTNSLTGVLKAGASITVSGDSNILFVSGGVSAFGSISLIDADGTFSVDAYSNKVLKDSVVTVTVGSVSKTVKVNFTASASAADIKNVVIDGAASILPGRTAVQTIQLVDKFGNLVEVAGNLTVTNGGVGYLSSYPTVTAAGKASTVLVTGTADEGDALITVTSAGPDGTLGAGDDDITVTKTIKVGAAPVAAAAVAGATGAVKLTVRNAAGQGVVVTVNGKTVIARRAAAAIQAFSAKTTAGKKTVVVKVAGKTVATRTVTVK